MSQHARRSVSVARGAVITVLALLLAACGAASTAAGTYVHEEEGILVVDDDGTASLDQSGQITEMSWLLDGETLTFTIHGNPQTATLTADGILFPDEAFSGSGDTLFARADGDVVAQQDDDDQVATEPESPEPTEAETTPEPTEPDDSFLTIASGECIRFVETGSYSSTPERVSCSAPGAEAEVLSVHDTVDLNCGPESNQTWTHKSTSASGVTTEQGLCLRTLGGTQTTTEHDNHLAKGSCVEVIETTASNDGGMVLASLQAAEVNYDVQELDCTDPRVTHRVIAGAMDPDSCPQQTELQFDKVASEGIGVWCLKEH